MDDARSQTSFILTMIGVRPVARKSLHVDASGADGAALDMLKALGSETRIAILQYLGDRVVSVNQIAGDLGLPPSTATMHIVVLEKAGLLHTEMRPASRGLQKVCARTYDELVIALPRGEHHTREAIELTMPIGGYSDFSVEPTCGLARSDGLIGYLDDANTFYEPDRLRAQLLWFRVGFVEYRFPNRVPPGANVLSLQLTAEVCSEAPLHDPDWPSDISVWINGIHLGEWTCPGDFGGVRGRLTPSWWEDKDSQFGVLKRWRVSSAGTSIDGLDFSSVDIDALALRRGDPITIRIGVRSDAQNVGGLNLFGREFGNYPEDLGLRIEYDLAGVPVTEPEPTSEALVQVV
jgi:predicted transcriptional regulator